ncbi:autotransporter assembly complex family protein [soil metagenome]
MYAAVGIASMLAAAPLRAQQTNPAPAPANPSGLSVDSPLAPLPDLGIDWPDLASAPVGTDTASEARADVLADTHYDWKIDGLDDQAMSLLRQRFDGLSVLNAHDGDTANAAQIDRRAREDSALLTSLLRAEGYYDARVSTSVEPANGRLLVTLAADPGALYHFKDVTLNGVAAAGDKADALRQAFGVSTDDAVNADAVVAGQGKLAAQIGEAGFPFAEIGQPEIVVDHATRTATLDLSVKPGGERVFGRIVASNDRVFGAHHIQEIARFTPGDPYSAGGLDDLRRALIQTGLVASADVKPVEGSAPGTVDVAVNLEPAPPRTIAGEIGYGTGEGARVEASWTHRNFFKPEGALTLRGVLGTKEQLSAVTFRRSNFGGRDKVLTAELSASHTVRDAYEARTFSVSSSLERQTNIFFQKAWAWSFGGELVATDERDVILSTGAPRQRTYFIGALPTSLTYDGTDDLLNPSRGFRLGGRVSPELSFVGKAFGYTRTQIDASAYYPVNDRVVVAGRVRLGTILGAPRDAIAPSRRFYAGGGGSVRGYGYQAIGARDLNGDPIGGRSLAEFSIETRVKAFGNFGIVPFLDGGNISTSASPRLSGMRYGTGIGLRYYSNFVPIRIDVGTPLNRHSGDSRIAVYVSLGQAF